MNEHPEDVQKPDFEGRRKAQARNDDLDHDSSLREYLLDSSARNDQKREDHPDLEFLVETRLDRFRTSPPGFLSLLSHPPF